MKTFATKLKNIIVLICIVSIIFLGIKIVFIYRGMIKELNEARAMVMSLKLDDDKIKKLEEENKNLKVHVANLKEKRDQLMSQYEHLKNISIGIGENIKSINRPELNNSKNVKALLSDIERYRNYTFVSDSIFQNEK